MNIGTAHGTFASRSILGDIFSDLGVFQQPVKRKQITHDEALSAQKAASLIPVRLISIDIQQALKLAIEFNIYAYDAYYLQCARAMSRPLITLDRRMKQVATKLNIEVLE